MRRPRIDPRELVVPLGAIAATLALGSLLVAAAGANPLVVYGRLFSGALLAPYGLGQTIFKATPLIFAGLSVSLAARAGLFNVGAEGQIIAGGYAMAAVGFSFPDAPLILLLPSALVAGALAGALWTMPAAVLRARLGASEVISTILLNWIAIHWFGFLLRRHVAQHPSELAESARTLTIGRGAWLPRLDAAIPALRGSQASVAFFLALAAVAVTTLFLSRTRGGFELRAVGMGRQAAEALGIPVARVEQRTLLLSGALSGLAGSAFILGAKHCYEEGFSAGAGFTAIAVAFLGRTRPIGVLLAALFLAALSEGGLATNRLVPREITTVMGAMLIAAVAVAGELARRASARRAALRVDAERSREGTAVRETSGGRT